MKKQMRWLLSLLALFLLAGCQPLPPDEGAESGERSQEVITLATLPDYAGEPYVEIAGNVPDFPEKDQTANSFERYSQLDYYGRCGAAYANVSLETMPTEERGSIGQIKPSGWHTVKYDSVEGKYLYNRCHLVGYQLTGENANACNLITGTRYLNVTGMLPFEDRVAEYVRQTGNHVLYRVTPIYQGSDLVARGVEMEGQSVEDGGEGVSFHIFAYNVQPGIQIDYATGESWLAGEEPPATPTATAQPPATVQPIQEPQPDPGTANTVVPSPEPTAEETYLLNTSSKKFHTLTCPGGAKTAEKNRQLYTGTRAELEQAGYSPCGSCLPEGQ